MLLLSSVPIKFLPSLGKFFPLSYIGKSSDAVFKLQVKLTIWWNTKVMNIQNHTGNIYLCVYYFHSKHTLVGSPLIVKKRKESWKHYYIIKRFADLYVLLHFNVSYFCSFSSSLLLCSKIIIHQGPFWYFLIVP